MLHDYSFNIAHKLVTFNDVTVFGSFMFINVNKTINQ